MTLVGNFDLFRGIKKTFDVIVLEDIWEMVLAQTDETWQGRFKYQLLFELSNRKLSFNEWYRDSEFESM